MIRNLIKVASRLEYNLYSYASERLLNALKAKYPGLKQDLDNFQNKNKYIVWLADRFGENPTKEEIHPIKDCLSILLNYSNREAGLAQKYKSSEEFKNLIEEKTKKTFENLSIINDMSINDIVAILSAARRKKEVVPTTTSVNIEGDKVGKVGPWNIWLPSSRDNSIHIAQFDTDDDGNKMPKTDWCTARTDGSNLFYNYIGRAGGNFMLFYIIKDNAQHDDDYLSVGFEDSKPVLPCGAGGESVDRANEGLSEDRLWHIWREHYPAIMDMMQKKCDELEGISPGFSKIEEASKDLNKFKALLAGNSKQEKRDLVSDIFRDFYTIPEAILQYLLLDNDPEIKKLIAEKTKDEELKKKLADDPSPQVRKAVVRNIDDESLFMKLAQDSDPGVRERVAWKIASKEKYDHITELLIKDTSPGVRLQIASNSNNTKFIKELASDTDTKIQEQIARRSDDEETLKIVALQILQSKYPEYNNAISNIVRKIKDQSILGRFVSILNFGLFSLKEEAIKKIDDESILMELAKKDHCKSSIIEFSKNQNVLMHLLEDENVNVRIKIAKRINESFSEDLLKKIISDPSVEVRSEAVKRINDESILKILARDKSDSIKLEAISKIKDTQFLKQLYEEYSSGDASPHAARIASRIQSMLKFHSNENEDKLASLIITVNNFYKLANYLYTNFYK